MSGQAMGARPRGVDDGPAHQAGSEERPGLIDAVLRHCRERSYTNHVFSILVGATLSRAWMNPCDINCRTSLD